MKILIHNRVLVTKAEAPEPHRRESSYCNMVRLACEKAIQAAGRQVQLCRSVNAGIVFHTVRGENWPLAWTHMYAKGEPVLASHFEYITHNAAAGSAAIWNQLTGAQITVVEGDPQALAALELISRRSKLMVVCKADTEEYAEAFVMETI